MTIEGVACQRGSTMDLYHPSFFRSAEDLIKFILNQRVYLYGWHNVNHSPTTVVVDTKKCAALLSHDKFIMTPRHILLQLDLEDSWIVKNPEIPPEQGWITNTVKTDMWNLRIRFLHERDGYTPKYYSVDQSPEIVPDISQNNAHLILSKTSPSFSTHKSIFFVNGLCCYPERYLDPEKGDSVRLYNGRTYLRNQKDRARGAVIVDFSNLAELEYIKLSSCKGDINSFKLPSSYDMSTTSFLLVVDGRLFMPDEFIILSNGTIIFDTSRYRDVYALDRLCCSNAFSSMSTKVGRSLYGSEDDTVTRYLPMTRNLVTDNPNLYRNSNSFVIVIKRGGLKVVRHRPLRGTNDGVFLQETVTGEQLHHITFNSSAAGLLFDTTTRSVTDYTEETNDQDFYSAGIDIKYVPTSDDYPLSSKTYYKRVISSGVASYRKAVASDFDEVDSVRMFKSDINYFESKPLPQRWSTKMLYIKHNTPLERWGNPNNVMSASASMHDNKTVRGDAQVIWPRYTMLDFIFEG